MGSAAAPDTTDGKRYGFPLPRRRRRQRQPVIKLQVVNSGLRGARVSVTWG